MTKIEENKIIWETQEEVDEVGERTLERNGERKNNKESLDKYNCKQPV